MVLFGMKDEKKDDSKGVDPKYDTAGYDARGDLVFDCIEVDERSGVRTVVFSYTNSAALLRLPEGSVRTRTVNLIANGQTAVEEYKALAALEALK